MTLFVIKTGNDKLFIDWFKGFKKRIEDNNLVKNPFNIFFKQFKKGNDLFTLISITPVYPNMTWIGSVTGIGLLLVFGFTYWVIPCFIIGCLGFFWSSSFYYLMLKLGLKKINYRNVGRIDLEDFAKEIIFSR